MIYEGSNEIQANDLLLRKVLGDDGRAFGLLLAALRTEAGQGGEYAECAGFARALGSLCDTLADVVEAIRERTRHDSEYPLSGGAGLSPTLWRDPADHGLGTGRAGVQGIARRRSAARRQAAKRRVLFRLPAVPVGPALGGDRRCVRGLGVRLTRPGACGTMATHGFSGSRLDE